MKHRRSTPEDLRTLRDTSADPADRAIALNSLAADRLANLEPEIVGLLDDPASELREEAIQALVLKFELDAFVPRAMAMLASDPSEYVRATAAHVVGHRALRSDRHREDILRALVRAIERDSEGLVAGIAYDKLRRLLPAACPALRLDPLEPEEVRAMVDWNELAAYRGH